jgi:YegS/Rv2252/BmrU family lipid kinase
MRPCVIFNPSARGDKARRFASFLTTIAPSAQLLPTTGPGSARTLARDAATAGEELIIAAGGDGTVFEVLNGIADAPHGLLHTTLSVLPLGTANVFAHELGIPQDPALAWKSLLHASPRTIDCGLAEFHNHDGSPAQARFVIVAGAGLDARAVQLVDWNLKRHTGKFAYITAACRALLTHPDLPRCHVQGTEMSGRAILVGNGRFYAGDLPIFPDGDLSSGRLHVRAVRRVSPDILLGCLTSYLTGRWSLDSRLQAASTSELHLTADAPVPLQLDGEFVGWLPATLRIQPGALRVLAPPIPTAPAAP